MLVALRRRLSAPPLPGSALLLRARMTIAAIRSSSSCDATQHPQPLLVQPATPRGCFSGTLTLLAMPNRKKKHMPRVRHENETNPLAKPTPLDPKVLYVVSVPIGNVKDFTLRALDVLRSCDYIICVDRDGTRAFLEMIDIDHAGRLIQLNRSASNSDTLIDLVRSGSSVALVASQGTPCVGDEGGRLVRDMLRAGVRVSPVPGVDACTTALTMSGACTAADGGAFRFGAFLSSRRGQRLSELRIAAQSTHPSVYFEVGSRLLDTLTDIAVVAPGRRVAVMHEMTKVHEATHADRVERLIQYYQRPSMTMTLRKGQLCIVINGALPSSSARCDQSGDFLRGLQGGSSAPSHTDPAASSQQQQQAVCSWQTDLRGSFVHHCVHRCIAYTGQSVQDAVGAVALTLGMTRPAVQQAFDFHESSSLEASGDERWGGGGGDELDSAVHIEPSGAKEKVGNSLVTRDALAEERTRARSVAAARYLRSRARLRMAEQAGSARVLHAMTTPDTGDLQDHMPSDWEAEPQQPGVAADVTTSVDYIQRQHDASAVPAAANAPVPVDDDKPPQSSHPGSECSTTPVVGAGVKESCTELPRGKGKEAPVRSRALRKRLALMRRVDERREHVRLLQLGLLVDGKR